MESFVSSIVTILGILAIVPMMAQSFVVEVGLDRCNFGESASCSQLKTAQRCETVEHCITSVWTSQQVTETFDDTIACQVCESVVDDMIMLSRDEEDERKMIIDQYLDSACAIIPDQDVAKECKNIVNNSPATVWQLLASELYPRKVCSLMQLCRVVSRHIKRPVDARTKTFKNPTKEEVLCTDCKNFFRDLKAYVLNGTIQDQIVDYVETKVCSLMGKLEKYCDQMVSTYVPEFFNLITTQFDPSQVCTSIGFCSNNGSVTVNMQRSVSVMVGATDADDDNNNNNDDDDDDDAKSSSSVVMRMAEAIQSANPTQQDMHKNLEEACSMLSYPYRVTCMELVNQHSPDLFAILEKNVAAKKQNQEMTLSMMMFGPRPRPSDSNNLCGMCKGFMNSVDKLLEENSTVQNIEKLLNLICRVMPSQHLRDQCLTIVELYGPAVIQLISHFADPEQVCKLVKLCTDEVANGEVPRRSSLANKPPFLVDVK